MNENSVPFVQNMIAYFEYLINQETDLKRKTILFDNKIHLEQLLLKFWNETIENDDAKIK